MLHAIGGVLFALYAMRDLTRRLCEVIPSIPEPTQSESSSYSSDAVRASIAFILNTGLEACLDAAMDELVSIDALSVSLEIIEMLLPRSEDIPSQHLQVVSSSTAPSTAAGEFGEFDDLFADDVWASVDLDTISAASGSVSKQSSLKSFEDAVLRALLANVRIGLQRVVIKFPQQRVALYHELYAVELLGRMVSTCSFQFGWSLVSVSTLKPRVLAPRLFSATLKHHREKEWFSTCFLSESGADQELAAMWLMGTLDLRALLPSTCTFESSKTDRFTFPVAGREAEKSTLSAGSAEIRYANYWIMLTDAIIYNILRENPVVQYKIDPLIMRLLRATARNSKFAHTLQSATGKASTPSDLATLYALHLDVFQEFCRSSGDTWSALSANPTTHRSEMNRFRLKTMDVKSGVFTAFPEYVDTRCHGRCEYRWLVQGYVNVCYVCLLVLV